MYQALYRKYRPLKFADVVGQEAVTDTLISQLAGGKVGHAYLFTGTRGTGKTTCAKILSRAVNCLNPQNGDPCNECSACKSILEGAVTDVFEIDAASNNSVDNVRELREDVIYTPAVVNYKVYIIDEVHRMSGPAFDALLKTIEEPPAHVIFILATTELHKVPATILSRCQRFDFRRIDAGKIADRLSEVAVAEGIDLMPDAAGMLGRMGQGSMRDALSLLERATALEGKVDAAAVGDLLGLCDPKMMMDALFDIAEGNTAGVLRFLDTMWQASKDIGRLLSEMSVVLRNVALSNIAPDLVAASRSQEELEQMQRLLQKMGGAKVLYCLETLQKGMRDVAHCTDARVVTEITLMRMCEPRLSTSAAAIVARLEALESGAVTVRPVKSEKAAAPQKVSEKAPEQVREQVPPAPTQETPSAASVSEEKLWQEAMIRLSKSGYVCITSLLPKSAPKFTDNEIVLEMEDGFAKLEIAKDDIKNALLTAIYEVSGKQYRLRIETPAQKAPVAQEDALYELADRIENNF